MPRSRPPWWVVLGAASFLAYFALLVYCDIGRPEFEGLSLVSGTAGLTVERVAPASPAARAGIVAGDQIVVADRHLISSRAEWIAIDANVRFDRPIALDVIRGDRRLSVLLPFSREPWSHWTTREGAELLITRAVQLVTLLLGLVIVFRRPFDPVARLGAWLLCAIGVFCVVLPYRIADLWRHLPGPVGAMLWLPLASTHLVAPLLLTFFMTFPTRRVRSAATWAAIWAPGAIVAAICLRFDLVMVYRPDASSFPPDGLGWLGTISIAYLVATAVAAIVNYRALHDVNERRRLRVLLLGAIIGGLAAGPIFLAFWGSAQVGLFTSPAFGLLALGLLTVPVSLAYAILRHRLFDVRLIVRQGVRYALARRLLLSLVPALLLVLALDVYNRRDQAIAELVVARASVYLVLVAIALLAQFQRQRWLDALDRRFFRERYDAQRLLRRVAEDIRDSGRFERAAAQVVVQIDLALHPQWVSVLVREPGTEGYRLIATAPPGAGPDTLPIASRLSALASVLGKPLDVSNRGTAWLAEHLPEEETALVRESGLELLVPIAVGPDRAEALLALGARRSDEPYSREDLDLLSTIAANLAVVLAKDRDRGGRVTTFGECPRCGRCCDAGVPVCPEEGSDLTIVGLPRTLAGRYRLDRRLGRGGMGVVYEASDLALERAVAVKVLREHLLGNPEAAARFRLEARISAGFAHPHVVTIYDFGIADDARAFLVMERLTGTTLRVEMDRQGRLDPARALSIMRAVCSAVDAAHRRGLVHRDLKPENVFLARADGVESPKVLDFGIAKVVLPPETDATSDGDTAAGMMIGTPQYMAPEQLRGEETRPSWDVWALGVMAYEMLTGNHPFATLSLGPGGNSPPGSYATVLSLGVSEVDPGWQPFFTRALAIDPDRRRPGAAAFLGELQHTLAQE
jgi:eukaryotic-like serine/threonine-protein kinase